MGFEEIWNEYTSSEKDMFQKKCQASSEADLYRARP